MTSDDQKPPELSGTPEDEHSVGEMESADHFVRAHDFIEDLRADRRPLRADSDDAALHLHETAALLRAASPDSAKVDPAFASRLFARLEAERRRLPAAHVASPDIASTPEAEPPSAPVSQEHVSPRRGMSRRGLLWGSLGAAAAAVAGAAVTSALERTAGPPVGPLVPAGTGQWVAVAAVSTVPLGMVKRFEAGAVIGYLQHTANGFTALSGVCTHMACLLTWNAGEKTFDCPCHGVQFLTNGRAAPNAPYSYAPLPTIETKVEADHVWVYVASGPIGSQEPQGAPTPTSHGYNDPSGG
ncbi:MAG TPA: Rieske (2Fe-2S) protein [Ktedonobacterales bacterium]